MWDEMQPNGKMIDFGIFVDISANALLYKLMKREFFVMRRRLDEQFIQV